MAVKGYTLISVITALAIMASAVLTLVPLLQQLQWLQQVQIWQSHLLQLQQAQRAHYQAHGYFADSQQQLIQSGLLPANMQFPHTGPWQFNAQDAVLTMNATITNVDPELLLKGFRGYQWQPPTVTFTVVGYATP